MDADVIVLGTGGVGSAAAYHLARRGARVLGLDRYPGAHDRGSSHGESRVIRLAYFEHPDYVPLLRRAYELWEDLAEASGEELYRETGLIQVGPPGGEIVRGVRASAARHDLAIEEIDAGDVASRFPGFQADEGTECVFEARAGYLRVERCVHAHLRAAAGLGATLRSGVSVAGWEASPAEVRVRLEGGAVLRAGALVVAAGAWAHQILGDAAPGLDVRRAHMHWFPGGAEHYRADHGCPVYLFDTPRGVFYGFPAIGERGVKLALHGGGRAIADPRGDDGAPDAEVQRAVEGFAARHLPRLRPEAGVHQVCWYTMSPDGHFIVDRHPAHPNVVVAAGLSGHGFKFASVLGEILADLALDGRTRHPIAFLSPARFSAGRSDAAH